MALTLITNPVGAEDLKLFAGFQKCEVVFKREDVAIDDIESGVGGIKINVSTDLTGYLSEGDVIYIYSEGTDYIYNGTGTITAITATDITLDTKFIQTSTGGYINYKRNYYVELQCVDKEFPDVNILDFNLQSDGDNAGNIIIDVSITNELNTRRGIIADGFISQSTTEFEIQYREVYEGNTSNPFTLVNDKLFVMLHAIDTPVVGILNNFDKPMLYLGYPGGISYAVSGLPESSTIELTYKELNINKLELDNDSLGSQAADVNGFIMWEWPADVSVNAQTKYIEFETIATVYYDFAEVDFDYPDFLTE